MDRAKSKKMKYDFRYFLLISKTYKLGRLPKKGKKKKSRTGQQDTLTFVNAEEELFFKVSSAVSDCSVHLLTSYILLSHLRRAFM